MTNVILELLWFDKDAVAAPAGTQVRERETGIVWEANENGSWEQVGTYELSQVSPVEE